MKTFSEIKNSITFTPSGTALRSLNQPKISAFLKTTIAATIAATLPTQSLAAESIMLEEVIVTAQKKVESLQDTPISIVAFDSSSLEEKGINTVVDIRNNVSNLQLTAHPDGGASPRIFMRGVGYNGNQLTADPSVAVYMDGVYTARTQGQAMEVGDIERIEVLRGPQGSLYGRNSTGGAVNFITAGPSTDGLEFKQSFTGGSLNQKRSKTTINLPVNDDFAVKLGYLVAKKDGFVDNAGTGEDHFGDQDRTAWRVGMLWEASDDLSLRYSYDHSSLKDTAAYISAVSASGVDNRPSSGSEQVTGLKPNDVESQGHTLIATWDLSDNLTFKSISSHREVEALNYNDYHYELFGPIPALSIAGLQTQEQTTQEFQFLGTALDDRLDFVAGAYYFHEEADELSTSDVVPFGVFTETDLSIENSALALFGQATYTPDAFDSRMHITFGARWSEDEREASLKKTGYYSGFPTGSESGLGKNDFSSFNPSLVVAYDLTNDINLYGKVVSGYKTGGFNVLASTMQAFSDGYDSEELTSYELGIKSEMLDNRVRLNAAVFYSDYTDIQTGVQVDPTDPKITDVLNAGKASITGLELELTALLTEALTLDFSLGLLDTQYKEIIDGNGNEVSDNFRFINAPETSYSLGLDYQFPSLAFGELKGIINYSWQDEKFSKGTVDNGVYVIEDYGLLSARLTLSELPISTGDLRISLWGKNITDEEYYLSHTTIFTHSAIYGDPKSYGIDVTFEL